MYPTYPQPDTCALCERDIPATPVEDQQGIVFCSPGCREVQATLGDTKEIKDNIAPGRESESSKGDAQSGIKTSSIEGTDSAFLQIDGMHCVTCEAFLESLAEGCEGVIDAEASYVTETIRVDHDPDQISKSQLCDTLSTVGYTAIPRDDGTGGSTTTERRTRDQRQPGGQGLDDMLGFRYAVGVIFGTFMLLPYVVMLYPAQIAAFFEIEAFRQFAGTSGVGGADGLLILPLFLILTGVVLFFTGLPLLRGAYVSVKMRRPNTDLLVTLTVVSAYVYSTIAFLLGRIDVYYDLTIVIAAGVVAAIFYESLVKQRAMDLLTDLTISHVDEARLYEADGTTTTVAVADLEPGDRVLVRQGERIPVDGVLNEGQCTVDEAVVTGESLPVLKQPGDDVVGGSIITDDAAVVTVSDRATSTVDRLITSVWNLQSANHGVQRRADQLASVVIPIVVGVGILASVASLAYGASLSAALLALLTVFIVACPWALGLATPLSVAASIKQAMDRGIVVFDETVFERLRAVDIVVFDKTGTLTTGKMEVIDADVPKDLLAAAAALELRASHPAAEAIVAAFGREGRDETEPRADGGTHDSRDGEQADRIREFTSHSAGVEGTVNGTEVLVGHLDCFADQGWEVSEAIKARVTDARGTGQLPVIVGRDGRAEGIIIVGDEPREGWDRVVTRLSDQGIETVVLTGDDREATDFFSDHPHVDYVFAGVPPAGKTATIRRLQSDKAVAMVGDGTNDAPALARADLGISLGSGTALASDAADIAIVDDDLTSVETAFALAQAARRRVKQNTMLAFCYNGITIPVAAVGVLNPLIVMVAVIASSSLIAMNSFRKLLNE